MTKPGCVGAKYRRGACHRFCEAGMPRPASAL